MVEVGHGKNQKTLRKMTQTDKEKIEDTLDYIDHLIMATEVDRNDFANTAANSQAGLLATMVKELEKIKKILES